MAAHLCPTFNRGYQFFTNAGLILAGGLIYVYVANTTTLTNTWTTSGQSVLNANPIVLDSFGRVPNAVWLDDLVEYKFVLKTSADVTIQTIGDYVTGLNNVSAVPSQWIDSGYTPTYISGTSFSVTGDRTAIFQVGRRVQATVTAGTVYSTISASSYGGAITTVTVVNDSTALDAGLSDVNVGFVTPIGSSIGTTSIGDFASVLATRQQTQLYQAFTTAGTATAYTLTPSPAITALATNQRWRVKFNAANTSTTPTLAVSGLTAKALKVYGTTGAKEDPAVGAFAANMLADVEYDGTDYVVLDQAPRATTGVNGTRVTRSADTSALTSGVATTLGWDTETFDDASWHDNSVNNSRITVNATGRYRVHVNLSYYFTATNFTNLARPGIILLKNSSSVGTYYGHYNYFPNSLSSTATVLFSIEEELALTSGDFLEAQAIHTFTDTGTAIVQSASSSLLVEFVK